MRSAPLCCWTLALGLAAGLLQPAPATADGGSRFTLANGLRVWIAPPGAATGLGEILLTVAAGSSEEGADENGAAWVTARALTSPNGGEDLRRTLARQGVSLEIAVERGIAQIDLIGPGESCLPVLGILAGLLARPALPVAAWSAAEAEWRQGAARDAGDVQARGDRRLNRLAWGEPESAPSPDEAAGVAADRIARLEAFRARTYGGVRMALAIRGDLPVKTVEAEVRRVFSGLPSGTGPAGPGRPPGVQPAAAVDCLQVSGLEPPILLVGRGVEVADDAGFFGWQALAHILGESHSSRLVRRLRLEEPLVYTVETDWLAAGRQGLTLRVSCQTDNVERSREVILEEIARLAEKEVTPRELATAVAILRSRILLDRESLHGELARWARGALASAPGLDLAVAGPLLDRLTPASLLALARRSPRPEVTVVVGDQPLPLCAAAAARNERVETSKEGDR